MDPGSRGASAPLTPTITGALYLVTEELKRRFDQDGIITAALREKGGY